MGFSLSPSDLERGWKHRRSSMNGSVCSNSLRRTKSESRISIHRFPIDNSYINKKYGVLPSETISQKAANYVRSRCACSLTCFISFITSVLPVLSWLPKYKLEYLLPDVISGFTIAILHIPQGMAYGVLAALRPENGLYVSFFPVIIYFLLGTSRHISIGTFAVMSLMMSSAMYGTDAIVDRNTTSADSNISTSLENAETWPPTHLEIATSVAMAVGFWQLFMGVFQLGSLTVVLSDQLVSGFTTGAACHVAVSQMKDLFGIHIGRYSGPLKLIYMLRDVFENLIHLNGATVAVSAVAIFVLAIFKEQIDGRLKEKLKMPIPIDLIVVVLATTASYFGKFHENYAVSIMKDIPTGLPPPVAPRFDILHLLVTDSFAIAIVAFAISLSMAKLLSKKNKYSIRPNQELVALGCANVFSSFFSCYPCSLHIPSGSRKAGGKLVAAIVSCGFLLVVLLALAPMFYSLPK
ncbi:solute carrier family 26 member 6-like, partial [Stegodyphus dumicola]|uniref:solute carrier family 26 member 6-like n=1 Tax=Stegodyphus dumicola TaxID=202533 RepID=UPI0015A80611